MVNSLVQLASDKSKNFSGSFCVAGLLQNLIHLILSLRDSQASLLPLLSTPKRQVFFRFTLCCLGIFGGINSVGGNC